jgi:hypothetical protein
MDTGVNQDSGEVTGKEAPGNKTFPQKSNIGHDPANTTVVPATPAPMTGERLRGGPAQKAPSGKGVVESGGGSFDQK